ncbi:MAG: pyrimidine dimer DNA glycosylase/endonuclease V [Ginsengibacter sp.]
MRIWSIHPKYLDSKGLVALWREALLAKNVLEGKTKGYRNHPQLERFKKLNDPLDAINFYLSSVYEEALKRKYNFDTTKFNETKKTILITVTHQQVEYEFQHLLLKLKSRDKKIYDAIKNSSAIEPHPVFTIVQGPVEP